MNLFMHTFTIWILRRNPVQLSSEDDRQGTKHVGDALQKNKELMFIIHQHMDRYAL
jgi:hypothetical protein